MAIEFDTYYNGNADPVAVIPPSQDDHIAFVQNGETDKPALPADITIVDNLENGNYHSIEITWDPISQFLTTLLFIQMEQYTVMLNR